MKRLLNMIWISAFFLTGTAVSAQAQLIVKKNAAGQLLLDVANNNANIFVGTGSGSTNELTAHSNVAVGETALSANLDGYINTAVGKAALFSNVGGWGNTCLGGGSGLNNLFGINNVAVGQQSLHNNVFGSDNIAIGAYAGYLETGSNKLYIENSITGPNAALIYGEFDNNYLQLNADVSINGEYTLPSTPGLPGHVLGYQGLNQLGWINLTNVFDVDGDTGIEVEASIDDDHIRFDISGNERFVLKENANGEAQLIIKTQYRNLFIGDMAGDASAPANGFGTDNVFLGDMSGITNVTGYRNTFIGSSTGKVVDIGHNNTFVGALAGTKNNGSSNTFVGSQAGGDNIHGTGNIFIGHAAGYSETGSNKLYIDNLDASSGEALIYGEFDNDYLQLNADVNINGAYTLPTTPGMPGHVLGYQGLNQLGWLHLTNVFDEDGDTGLEVEESVDDDHIRFDINGNERFVLKENANGEAQLAIKTSYRNLFIGDMAGDASAPLGPNGQDNVFVGDRSGSANSTGNNNTFLGSSAGSNVVTGDQNTMIGAHSGENNVGSSNTFVGSDTGLSNTTGVGNIFLGYQAGTNETGSNKLYIDNSGSNATGALIYGEFDNSLLRVNGQLGIGTNPLSGYSLHISDGAGASVIKQASNTNAGVTYQASATTWDVRFNSAANVVNSDVGIYMNQNSFESYRNDTLTLGSAGFRWKEVYATNPTINTSDRRFKKNINDMTDGLAEVMQMRPVTYQWKKEANGRIINGFIAQEMEEVVPEVVHISEVAPDPNKPETSVEYSELYGMRYTELIPVLTKAIQEQQALIEDLTSRLEQLESEK